MMSKELANLKELPQELVSFLLAVNVVADRMRRLPAPDADLIYKMMQDYATAKAEEDRSATIGAILEVLDQRPLDVRPFDLEQSGNRPEGLQKWVVWVSKQIKEAREEKNLSQQELADKSGLPQSHISRIENAKHSPSRTTLEKIAKALKVPISRFDPSADDKAA